MILDFGDSGNGPEVLWAGMFTLAAVIGSVLLALWSQRRDFDRREVEMKSAFEAQDLAQWSGWRRHMAERCMALITNAAVLAIDGETFSPAYFRAMHETEELNALLHLDCHDGGAFMGEWIYSQISAMQRLDERSVDQVKDVYDLAAAARQKIMDWAINPESVLADVPQLHDSGSAYMRSSAHD